MKKQLALSMLAGVAALAMSAAHAQETKVAVGISGWTGFAPLTLAKEAGIFKKERARRFHQKDPAKRPPPGDCLG
jgi:NitT/TauT family transport system substrate-binding protein